MILDRPNHDSTRALRSILAVVAPRAALRRSRASGGARAAIGMTGAVVAKEIVARIPKGMRTPTATTFLLAVLLTGCAAQLRPTRPNPPRAPAGKDAPRASSAPKPRTSRRPTRASARS